MGSGPFENWEEITPSPSESVSETQGSGVTRRLLVPWSSRLTAAASLTAGLYPHFPHTRIKSMRIDPWNERPLGIGGLDPILSTITYAGQQALITVEYGPDFTQKIWPFTKPGFRVGTELRYQIQSAGEFLNVSPSATQWEDDPDTAVLETNETVIRLSTEVINLQWDFVDAVPKVSLDALKGRVNVDTFLDASPETLLFAGYSIDETFKADPLNIHTNRVSVQILRREFVDAGQTFGWNHDYREDPAGYVRMVLKDGTPRYKLAPFLGMFA